MVIVHKATRDRLVVVTVVIVIVVVVVDMSINPFGGKGKLFIRGGGEQTKNKKGQFVKLWWH